MVRVDCLSTRRVLEKLLLACCEKMRSDSVGPGIEYLKKIDGCSRQYEVLECRRLKV